MNGHVAVVECLEKAGADLDLRSEVWVYIDVLI